MHWDYLHPCILGSKKDLPATRTSLTQAGARASKSFRHPRLERMTSRKRRGKRLRTTGQLEEEEKAQEQEENRGQGNIECVHLDWQQCLDRIWDFFLRSFNWRKKVPAGKTVRVNSVSLM